MSSSEERGLPTVFSADLVTLLQNFPIGYQTACVQYHSVRQCSYAHNGRAPVACTAGCSPSGLRGRAGAAVSSSHQPWCTEGF